MRINIKQLETADRSGRVSQPISYTLDLSHLRLWGHKPFVEPVRIEGELSDRTGIKTVGYTVSYTREDPCARCLNKVRTDHQQQFSHIIMEETALEDSEDEYIIAPGGILDVDELVTSDLLLTQEFVVLCSESCKGICPKCGADRNQTDCGCSLAEPDPRFDALREILEQNKE